MCQPGMRLASLYLHQCKHCRQGTRRSHRHLLQSTRQEGMGQGVSWLRGTRALQGKGGMMWIPPAHTLLSNTQTPQQCWSGIQSQQGRWCRMPGLLSRKCLAGKSRVHGQCLGRQCLPSNSYKQWRPARSSGHWHKPAPKRKLKDTPFRLDTRCMKCDQHHPHKIQPSTLFPHRLGQGMRCLRCTTCKLSRSLPNTGPRHTAPEAQWPTRMQIQPGKVHRNLSQGVSIHQHCTLLWLQRLPRTPPLPGRARRLPGRLPPASRRGRQCKKLSLAGNTRQHHMPRGHWRGLSTDSPRGTLCRLSPRLQCHTCLKGKRGKLSSRLWSSVQPDRTLQW